MRRSVLLLLLLIWGQDSVRSIRLQELQVPDHVVSGGEALFGCQFDLEGDLLYSLKWYKDGREIFRYVPMNTNQAIKAFEQPGVTIDISRSSLDVVTLTNLQPKSAGLYRCEVTGEAPLFASATAEKYVAVHVLPKSGPLITGLKDLYSYGHTVNINCTSLWSKPRAVIKWLVNNEPVHSVFLRGPWVRVDPSSNTTETTLGLHYMVIPSHYKSSEMNIKCQVTIPPLYHTEKSITRYRPALEYIDSEMEPDPETDFYPESIDSEIEPDPETELEPTPSGKLPSIEKDEDVLPDSSKEYFHNIREEMIERDREIKETVHLEQPAVTRPTSTEEPQNATDFAVQKDVSIGIMVITLLVQVVLL